MFRLALVCSALAFVAPQSKNTEDGPTSKVPELKPLDHYVGTWSIAFDNKDIPFENAKAVGKWVLGGRFMEQTVEAANKTGEPGLKLKTLFTFDTNRNAFRSWTFSADGSVSEFDAVWDANLKTMTSIEKKVEGKGFATITADFSKPGEETWKVAITDSDGKASGEITGKNTKEKKKP